MNSCSFDKLFSKSVPHILEKIFLSLDYESYKTCMEVNQSWKELFFSESYMKKSKSVFHNEISKDDKKLAVAVLKGNANEVCKLLSSKMIDVNKRSPHSIFTPLHLATVHGHIVVVQLLLDAGAAPNAANKYGITPLHKAIDYGYKNIVELILDRGGNLNKEDKDGNTPLQKAACKGLNETVKLLLERGAEVDKEDLWGHTALHWAAIYGHEDVVRTLLENGAMPNARDNRGRSPLYYAVHSAQMNRDLFSFKNGYISIVQILKKYVSN